jgi:hypothetical protein
VKEKKPKLPRGLYWRNGSPHIYFSWRDSRRTQHQESAGTSDPAQALLFKLQFLERQIENPQTEIELEVKPKFLMVLDGMVLIYKEIVKNLLSAYWQQVQQFIGLGLQRRRRRHLLKRGRGRIGFQAVGYA